jgi:hypothetical protein
MLRRTLIAAVLAAPAALVTGSVAQAAEPVPTVTYTTAQPGANAAQACANSDNAIVIELRLDGEVVESFPLSGPGELTRGACVSTVTRQELTTPAYVANCKNLEPMFAAANPTGRPYPYSFYGNPEYTAKNRAGCVAFLRAFHTGTLPPGP